MVIKGGYLYEVERLVRGRSCCLFPPRRSPAIYMSLAQSHGHLTGNELLTCPADNCELIER